MLEEKHLDQVVALENICFKSAWPKDKFLEVIKSESYQLYGLFEDKELISYLLVSLIEDYSEIINIACSPNYRQKGYAQNLLKFYIENNKCQIILEVASKNLAALNLYQKLGFKKIHIRKNYYNDNDDAIVMEKE